MSAEELKQERITGKRAVTTQVNRVSRLIGEEARVEDIKDEVLVLKAKFDTFSKSHDAFMETLADNAALDEGTQYLETAQENYLKALSVARSYIKDSESDAASIAGSAAGSTACVTREDLQSLVNLPKLTLEPFNGDPLKFHMFMAVFEQNVGCLPGSDAAKLARLLEYTVGRAREAIRKCSLIGGKEGYDKAMEILLTRFGDEQLITEQLIEELRRGAPVRSATDLQRFADELENGYEVLVKMGRLQELDSQAAIREMLGRLQPTIQQRWKTRALDTRRTSRRYPDIKAFVDFIGQMAYEVNDPIYGTPDSTEQASAKEIKPPKRSFQTHLKTPAAQDTMLHGNSRENPVNSESRRWQEAPCCLCNDIHRLWSCRLFQRMTVPQRCELVRRNTLCENCLQANHTTENCTKRSVCSVPGCREKHTRFLHPNVSQPASPRIPADTQREVSMNSNNVDNRNTNEESLVYMPVVPVIVNDMYHTFALLDNASTQSFCSADLIEKLGVEGSKVRCEISTLIKIEEVETEVVDLKVRAKHGPGVLSMSDVHVVDRIDARVPPLGVRDFDHLRGIPLSTGEVEVGILIGQDHPEALFPLEMKRSRQKELFAVRTMMGWTVSGKTPGKSRMKVANNFISTVLPTRETAPWDIDDATEELGLSTSDIKVLGLWDKACKFEDGRYELPIPWREDKAFHNNLGAAIPRLHSLNRSLHRKGIFSQYNDEVGKLLDKGYAEKVPELGDKVNDKVWYIPHQPVITSKKPGKLRLVFDCAAKYRGESLNDKAFQGPDLNNNLSHVLLRFRNHPYAFIADIEAMYNQVTVPENDRDALRFLWWDAEGNIQHYRMKRHLFGGVWCASAATYALRKAAEKMSPAVKETINLAFYVDDCLKSVSTKEEAESLIQETREALGEAGFRLTKFVANDARVLSQLPKDDIAKTMHFIGEDSNNKALGIKWDTESDDLYFQIVKDQSAPITKRKILSCVASLYDPLGLVGPVTLKGKMLYQEAVRLQLGWDDVVPEHLNREWSTWLNTVCDVKHVRIPRCVRPPAHTDAACELHHFSDASEKGYGCCSYLRSINRNGEIHVALIMSKSRVAPLRTITIPRLELQAAVLSARMDTMLRRELDLCLGRSYFWVDSQITLKYIKNEERRFQVFVANRVATIRRATDPEQWHHVSGDGNPADMISRGSTPKEMDANGWLWGPEFLRKYKSEWPQEKVDPALADGDPELKKQVVAHHVMIKGREEIEPPATHDHIEECPKPLVLDWHPLDRLINQYSSWQRLKRAVAWMLKIRKALQSKKTDISRKLSVEDMSLSEQQIIRHVQRNLRYQANSPNKKTEIKHLDPYVDENDIVRVGGRTAPATEDDKGQAIIPDGEVAQLIIRHYHEASHMGTEYTLAQTRTKYWIQRKEVKKMLQHCIRCKKMTGRSCMQKMANLPASRVAVGEVPFSHTGIDCFGPFLVKRGRSMLKRYGCVFTCLTTRAVHIEVLDSLDTDSFINGLRRFMARRGEPESITSDNGGNFVGANKELAAGLKELKKAKIETALLEKGITWNFIPPHSSHMGGAWERQIRSIRKVLQGVTKEQPLDDESLRTLMCEVENILNSRPITPVSDDPNDLVALRPSHLLLMKEGPRLPPCLSDAGDLYRRRWRRVQYLSGLFWKEWIRRYLPELQSRKKWQCERPNVSEGDLVLLVEENVPRNLWPLARVVQVRPSHDGLVRSVKVKTRNSELVRPITKLVMLEGRLY